MGEQIITDLSTLGTVKESELEKTTGIQDRLCRLQWQWVKLGMFKGYFSAMDKELKTSRNMADRGRQQAMLLDAEPDHAILLLDLLSFFLFPLHLRG
jgi:hypothetical protein